MPYNKERYQKLKELRICVYCGKNPAVGASVACKACKEKRIGAHAKNRDKNILYGKKYREVLKQAGLCIRCGKKDAVPGLSQCAECSQRSNERQHIYAGEAAGKYNQKTKDLYYERKARGICVKCGKNKALPGMVRCLDCRLFLNQSRSGYVEHTGKWAEKERSMGRL